MSIANKTFKGVIWNFLQQLGIKGVNIATTLLLAYFLVAEDFGLIATIFVFLLVGNAFMESGVRDALIRIENAGEIEYNTVFYSTLVLGGGVYIILYNLAPLIAHFYQETQIALLLKVLSIYVIVLALQTVPMTILTRNLNFKTQFYASIPGNVVSGLLAVALAYLGYGVWALIAQMLMAVSVTTLLLWLYTRWRPQFIFSFPVLLQMFRFGYKLLIARVLGVVTQNMYVVVIAKTFSMGAAGFYFFADKIKQMIIFQLIVAIENVTYPAFSRIQNEDERLIISFRKTVSVMTFIIFPIVMVLAALSEPLFHLILPQKWWPAIVYFQLLSFTVILSPMHSVNTNILKVKNRTDLYMYLEFLRAISSILFLFVTIDFGILAVIIGQAVNSVIYYIVSTLIVSNILNYTIFEQIQDFMPNLILSGVVALFIYYVLSFSILSDLESLMLLPMIALVLFLSLSFLFRLNSLKNVLEFANKKFKKS